MGSLNGAMTNMRDLTSQVTALGRQRKMTGNMSFGENFEPAIYKGLYESALGKMVDFGNLDVNKQNAETNRFQADTGRMSANWQHEYQIGQLGNESTKIANDLSLGLKNLDLGWAKQGSDAAYQQGQLGLGYANLSANTAFQQGQLANWGRQTDISQQNADIDALYKAGLLTDMEYDNLREDKRLAAQIATGNKQTDVNQWATGIDSGTKIITAASPALNAGAQWIGKKLSGSDDSQDLSDFGFGLEDGSDDMQLEYFNSDLSTETFDTPAIESGNAGDGWNYNWDE